VLNIKIDRSKGVPLYIQIREALKDKLQDGGIDTDRLPTERELADRLAVSRNTVSNAYRDLEDEGFIETRIGRGTFVTGSGDLSRKNREVMLKKAVEHSVEEALSLGFSLDEYQLFSREYVKEKRAILSTKKVVFVECNKEQLNYFSGHLELDSDISVIPILLRKLKDPLHKDQLNNADLIVTSFYHLGEVQKVLPEQSDSIMGIGLIPEMKTIIEIARIPSSETVGIITASEEFLREITRTLKQTGLSFRNILTTVKKTGMELNDFVSKCSALLVSPSRYSDVKHAAGKKKQIIEFLYTPDEASIKNLNIMLFEGKEHTA
jgi:GntR family transcriptional regulator